jgi:hypothetical protein
MKGDEGTTYPGEPSRPRSLWREPDEGSVLATMGLTTLIGCDNVDVPSWFATARRAGFDGDVLVLSSGRGVEIARMRRQGA